MKATTNTYLPNLNTVLKRAIELGIDCDHRARVAVAHTRSGITVTLLLDYDLINSDPCLASRYAIGAKAFFDGLTLHEYARIYAEATNRFSDAAKARSFAALNLMLSGKAVVVSYDDDVMMQILNVLEKDCQNTFPFGISGYKLMVDAKRYDGISTLAGARSAITEDMVGLDCARTNAEGGVCTTEEMLQQCKRDGMHVARRAKLAI